MQKANMVCLALELPQEMKEYVDKINELNITQFFTYFLTIKQRLCNT